MTTKELTKQLNKIEAELRQIRISLVKDNSVEVDHVAAKNDQKIEKIWKQARKKLQGKLPKNPVAWQKKVRAEW